MASAWGTSFGTAWANSWEARTPTPPVTPTVSTPSVGSVRRRGLRTTYARRVFVVGDKRYVFEGDGEIERFLVERIKAPVRVARVPKSAPPIPVNLEPATPIQEWGPVEFPSVIDFRSVEVLRDQSERLGQQEIIDALDRIVKRIKAIRDDDEEVELLLMDMWA